MARVGVASCRAGSLLQQLINWSSALLFVEINFLMPLLLYVFMSRRRKLYDVNCTAPKSFHDPRRVAALDPERSRLIPPNALTHREESVYGEEDKIEGDSVRTRPPRARDCRHSHPPFTVVVWPWLCPVAAPARVAGVVAQVHDGAVIRMVLGVGRRGRVHPHSVLASVLP